METIRRTIAFLVGLGIVVMGVTDSCPRLGIIAIGLSLMGLFSVPEALEALGFRPNSPNKGEK